MGGPQRSIAKRPARCRKARSSLVRRLVQARDDPAKQRIRRWLSDINDERLLSFGLTPEDIALLRGSPGSGNFAYLLLMCALSVPSPPVHSFSLRTSVAQPSLKTIVAPHPTPHKTVRGCNINLVCNAAANSYLLSYRQRLKTSA
jgi:hypothetical protein